MVSRVKLAFDRYTTADSSGRRSGKPRFKGQGRYRSFTYPQADDTWLTANRVQLPKIGSVKVILHRPLPVGFAVKTVCISKKAEHWYITFSLEDASVPAVAPDINLNRAVGIDLGLKDFLVDSEGERVPIPQYYRKANKRLARAQRALARKKNKQSKRRAKHVKKLARVHAKVTNQRRYFHHKTARTYVQKYEVIAHEKLNIKGLARTRLAKSVYDAGWGQFLSILAHKAERAGCITIGVNPAGTTQECSGCDAVVPKTLADRWHSCPHCGLELDRDENSARRVKQRAVGHPAQARGGDRKIGPVKREAHPTTRS
jgi:putative transposase